MIAAQAGRAVDPATLLVLSVVPEIGPWLFGPDAGKAGPIVRDVVGQVTGAIDQLAQAAAVQAAIQGDPALIERLRGALLRAVSQYRAEYRADAEEAARLADVVGARAQGAQLAAGRSPTAWGAPVVSVVVLAIFASVVAMVLTRGIPTQSEALLNVMLGTLAAMATSVVSYWVGSSAGSARKDDLLARQRGTGEA